MQGWGVRKRKRIAFFVRSDFFAVVAAATAAALVHYAWNMKKVHSSNMLYIYSNGSSSNNGWLEQQNQIDLFNLSAAASFHTHSAVHTHSLTQAHRAHTIRSFLPM